MIKSQFSFDNLKSREGDVFIIEHRSPALQVDSLSSAPGKLIRYLDSLIHSLAYNTIITWSPNEIMNILEFILTPFCSRI